MIDQPKPLSRSQQLFNRARDARRQEAEQQRKEDTNRKIVLGAAMIAASRDDPAFAEQFKRLLDKYVLKPADRKRIEEWLPQQRHSE
jgi:hypothetical protein